MKRLIGVSLLLSLILLAGCGSSSSPSANRIQVTGTFYDNESTVLTGTGTITVTPFFAGSKGLGQVADVKSATVNPDNGTVTLINVPADRKIVLKISFAGGSIYTWHVLDTRTNTFSIHPQEWAAGRLTFDLVRSYTDSRLDIGMFDTDYENLYNAIYSSLNTSMGSATLSAWAATPADFYTFLQGKISPAMLTSPSLLAIIKRAVGSTALDGDKRKTLASVTTDSEPSWPSEYTIHSEVADTDVDYYLTAYDRYLVANSNLLNITSIKAVKRVGTGASPTKEILVRVESRGSSQTSASTLRLIVRNPSLTAFEPYTLTYQSSSGDARYYECAITEDAPFTNLKGVSGDGTDYIDYYLFQVIDPSAQNWNASDYSSIDLDRTPCIFVKVPVTPAS